MLTDASATTDHFNVIIPRFVFWNRVYIEYAFAIDVDYGCRLSNCCHLDR